MKYLIRDANEIPVAIAQVKRGDVAQLRASLKPQNTIKRVADDHTGIGYGVPVWSHDHTSVAMLFG